MTIETTLKERYWATRGRTYQPRPRTYVRQPRSYPVRANFKPPSSSTTIIQYNTRQETKYFDTGINASVTWTGTDWSASEVPCSNYVNSSGTAAAYTDSALIPSANGSAYGQVVGNRYKLRKLRVRGDLSTGITSDGADVPAPVSVRLLLVHDTQANGAQAQGEDIMQDIGAGGENLYSFKRVANSSGRFRIVKDEFLTLQPAVTATDGTATNSNVRYACHFTMQYTPKKPMECQIKSGNATPTIAGLVNNNFFLILAGIDTNSGAANAVVIRAASRAYYSE